MRLKGKEKISGHPKVQLLFRSALYFYTVIKLTLMSQPVVNLGLPQRDFTVKQWWLDRGPEGQYPN